MHMFSTYQLRLLAAAFAALSMTGCSSELASFDDVYVPSSVEENFPITVVERSVRLSLDATPGGLSPRDASLVVELANRVGSRGPTPVMVSYASGSKVSRQAADQAAAILVHNGLPRYAIVVSPRDGRENRIVLAYSTKVAETKPCGDWSQNLRASQFNDGGPNFGCAVQQNMAAIVANPGDLEHAQKLPPPLSAAQSNALAAYNSGAWTQQVQFPLFSVGQ